MLAVATIYVASDANSKKKKNTIEHPDAFVEPTITTDSSSFNMNNEYKNLCELKLLMIWLRTLFVSIVA